MLRTTLEANETTDVGNAIADLRSQCESASLSPELTDTLILEASGVLIQLVERGKQLVSRGRQMAVTRELSGEGYELKISFSTTGAQKRKSFLSRVLDAIRG